MIPVIERVRSSSEGEFIQQPIFRTLDGSDVAEWLEAGGYQVEEFKDTGRNGLATTVCGISVSTNGYVHVACE